MRRDHWFVVAIGLATLAAISWFMSAWTQTIPHGIARFSSQWFVYTATASIVDTALLFGGSLVLSFLATRLGDQRGARGVVALALAITGVLTLVFGASHWSSNNKYAAKDGDVCGPHHHWVTINITPDEIPDLSCEDDAR